MKCFPALALAFWALTAPFSAHWVLAEEAPHIYLDKSPRVVAYQLKRLSNAQLVAVERKPDDVKYKPVYQALLTREGLDRKYRDEAVAALAQIDKSDPVSEILNTIGGLDPQDKAIGRELVGVLLAQKPEVLAAQKPKLKSLASDAPSDVLKQAAYAALAVADGKPDEAWQLAQSKNDLKPMLLGIPLINDSALRAAFYERVNYLVLHLNEKSPEQPDRVAAIEALATIPGHETEEFTELAELARNGSGTVVRDAAIRSIRRIPVEKWPPEQLQPLADQIVKLVAQTPADQRTQLSTIQAVQLGNDLAGELPDEQGIALRKKLRDLGVRVVVIRTLREQMQYDTRYFVVQAGKPVEVVLENGDAMPHNFVLTAPGALQDVAVAAGTMSPPANPADKAYIPDSPKVLQSMHLVQPGESETLSFVAPTQPGDYDFVCTFPGHWVRMYGVMKVVVDLDAYEKNPTPPMDPLLHKPMESAKNEVTVGH